ncbi:hypothetical protein SAMN04488056_10224 [Cohaesibacter marisflavi]|uniref:Uncharacterized protein n=1 Tax=Cohaesibacter marisflavi TaxID=655353 RepID=A0A1I5BWB6_9HYPH|nr:hypothetical protein SAMN04488056_10224 [Cohaesibacter marisflavi]
MAQMSMLTNRDLGQQIFTISPEIGFEISVDEMPIRIVVPFSFCHGQQRTVLTCTEALKRSALPLSSCKVYALAVNPRECGVSSSLRVSSLLAGVPR